MVDRFKELLAEFKTMMANDYGLPCTPISVKNPQANAIVERVHQAIGNIIRAFNIQDMDIDKLRALGKKFTCLLCLP